MTVTMLMRRQCCWGGWWGKHLACWWTCCPGCDGRSRLYECHFWKQDFDSSFLQQKKIMIIITRLIISMSQFIVFFSSFNFLSALSTLSCKDNQLIQSCFLPQVERPGCPSWTCSAPPPPPSAFRGQPSTWRGSRWSTLSHCWSGRGSERWGPCCCLFPVFKDISFVWILLIWSDINNDVLILKYSSEGQR